jgi:type I restriction enzyme, S subunit
MTQSIDIDPVHLKIVHDILQDHFSKSVKVWVFGSRATHSAKKFSDLDLAVDYHSQPIPMNLMADLVYDFEESALPYKVDVVDWNSMDKSFQNKIDADRVLLYP